MLISSRRSLALLSALVSMFVVVGCGKSSSNSDDSVGVQLPVSANSNEITYENYRDHNISIIVPPGNRNPILNWNTLNAKENIPAKTYSGFVGMGGIGGLTADELRIELDKRLVKVASKILKDPQILPEIRLAGKLYGIDPMLILGNIVGEHVYNVNLGDEIQEAYAKSRITGDKWAAHFRSNEIKLEDVLKDPQFAPCNAKRTESEFSYWECAGEVYDTTYVNRTVNGRTYGDTLFRKTFFNPVRVGLTYGLGQLDPIRALMVTDVVNRISGFPIVTIAEPEKIYADIFNPRRSVHYVAANILVSINAYKRIANFDISQNPGVVATMYNLGKEKLHATKRYNDNLRSLKAGGPIEMPRESYYGFFINEREQQLRKFLQTGSLY